QQFLDIARREGLDTAPKEIPDEALQKCILIGFSDRVARRVDSGTLRCELVHGRRGVLARESAVQNQPLLVAAEVREVEGKDQTVNLLHSLETVMKDPWLRELFPEDINPPPRFFYDATSKRVYAEEHLGFGARAMGPRRVDPPPPEEAARLLSEEVIAGRLIL